MDVGLSPGKKFEGTNNRLSRRGATADIARVNGAA